MKNMKLLFHNTSSIISCFSAVRFLRRLAKNTRYNRQTVISSRWKIFELFLFIFTGFCFILSVILPIWSSQPLSTHRPFPGNFCCPNFICTIVWVMICCWTKFKFTHSLEILFTIIAHNFRILYYRDKWWRQYSYRKWSSFLLNKMNFHCIYNSNHEETYKDFWTNFGPKNSKLSSLSPIFRLFNNVTLRIRQSFPWKKLTWKTSNIQKSFTAISPTRISIYYAQQTMSQCSTWRLRHYKDYECLHMFFLFLILSYKIHFPINESF